MPWRDFLWKHDVDSDHTEFGTAGRTHLRFGRRRPVPASAGRLRAELSAAAVPGRNGAMAEAQRYEAGDLVVGERKRYGEPPATE